MLKSFLGNYAETIHHAENMKDNHEIKWGSCLDMHWNQHEISTVKPIGLFSNARNAYVCTVTHRDDYSLYVDTYLMFLCYLFYNLFIYMWSFPTYVVQQPINSSSFSKSAFGSETCSVHSNTLSVITIENIFCSNSLIMLMSSHVTIILFSIEFDGRLALWIIAVLHDTNRCLSFVLYFYPELVFNILWLLVTYWKPFSSDDLHFYEIWVQLKLFLSTILKA